MIQETTYDLNKVRERPGMYVAGSYMDRIFYVFIYAFVQAYEEYKNGFADHIEITLLPNNVIRIADNGRGLSNLEEDMTILTQNAEDLPVVNALSKHMKVTVHCDGEIYTQEYSEGIKKIEVNNPGKTTFHGTVLEFELDKALFGGKIFDYDRISKFIYEQFLICKGLRLSLVDFRDDLDYKRNFNISENPIFLSDEHSPIAMKVQSFSPRRY
jgi:DNA gyrase subunit B